MAMTSSSSSFNPSVWQPREPPASRIFARANGETVFIDLVKADRRQELEAARARHRQEARERRRMRADLTDRLTIVRDERRAEAYTKRTRATDLERQGLIDEARALRVEADVLEQRYQPDDAAARARRRELAVRAGALRARAAVADTEGRFADARRLRAEAAALAV